MAATMNDIHELVSTGDIEKAQQELDATPADVIDAAERQLYSGILFERQQLWAEAADAYKAVLADDPEDSEAMFRLAYLVDRQGDDDRAIELYEQCTAESPAHVNALLNLAVLYEDAERYEEALSCLNRVLADHPNHTRARVFRKDVLASGDMYYDEESELFREKRNAILETPVSDFELSVRSRNCLKQMNIFKLGDLLKTTAVELLAYKNFGETSLHEIQAMLAQKGLRLAQLLEESESDLSGGLIPSGTDPAKANILTRSVAELELSVRSRKCLLRLGLNTIGELTQRSEAELLGIKNFGMTSLSEIKRRLTEHGLALQAD